MRHKIIAISPRYETSNPGITPDSMPTPDKTKAEIKYYSISKNYTKYLCDNFSCVIITSKNNIEDVLSLCDGILIVGGCDINPTYFNETNDEGLSKSIDNELDEIDNLMYQYAVNHHVPLLGICRGIQAIAAFGGGALHQDLAHDNVNHPIPLDHIHSVKKIENFGFAKLLPDEFNVNTYHHQAIKRVPNGYKVLFKNGDCIEAIEHETLPILGVQWHPERFDTNESIIIFDYFKKLILNNCDK